MSTRARREASRPVRRGSVAAVRREILVFREGLRTEEIYLAEWRRRYRDRVLVTIDPNPAGPLQLVERAFKTKEWEAVETKRRRGRPHDQIWCVFDRDDHPNRAVVLAALRGKVLTQAALDVLIASYPEARARAQKLEAKHAGDGSPEGSNPSTGVWRLIEEIRNA